MKVSTLNSKKTLKVTAAQLTKLRTSIFFQFIINFICFWIGNPNNTIIGYKSFTLGRNRLL